MSATLDILESKQDQNGDAKKQPKKAKWHLGIRSQSKPQDIMNEVFKAMKSCNMVRKQFFKHLKLKLKLK